eukprot:SAG31_NODE_3731_length_3942_cov_2.254749_4_plen_143_part_00
MNTGETFFVRLRLVLFEFGGGTARLLDLDDLSEPLRSVTKKQRREARRKLEAEEVRRLGSSIWVQTGACVCLLALSAPWLCRQQKKLLSRRPRQVNSPQSERRRTRLCANKFHPRRRAQSVCLTQQVRTHAGLARIRGPIQI